MKSRASKLSVSGRPWAQFVMKRGSPQWLC